MGGGGGEGPSHLGGGEGTTDSIWGRFGRRVWEIGAESILPLVPKISPLAGLPSLARALAQYYFGLPLKYGPRQLMGHGLVVPTDNAPFNVDMITGSLCALVRQVLPAVFLP